MGEGKVYTGDWMKGILRSKTKEQCINGLVLGNGILKDPEPPVSMRPTNTNSPMIKQILTGRPWVDIPCVPNAGSHVKQSQLRD